MLRTKAVLKCRTAVAIKGEIMGILIENLSFYYTGTPVLEQVNLEVKDGDYVILTGENGSGKSTFLKLLLGELKAQEGSITVNGKDISATFGKGDLGYVPQNSISRNQNFPATVEEIMMTGVYSSSWKARFQVKKEIPRLKAALAEMEMEEFWKRRIGDLSGGQQQRVMLARALVGNPKILILDEPTAGLDPKGRDDILDQIAELHKVRGITIVLVSHSMEDIAKYVERLIVMNHGEAVFDDTPKKVFSHYKELETMGLAAPQITYIMHALKEHGLNVDADATTVEEARDSILAALKASDSPLLKEGGAEK